MERDRHSWTRNRREDGVTDAWHCLLHTHRRGSRKQPGREALGEQTLIWKSSNHRAGWGREGRCGVVVEELVLRAMRWLFLLFEMQLSTLKSTCTSCYWLS